MTTLFWITSDRNDLPKVRGPYVRVPYPLYRGERVLGIEAIDWTSQYNASAYQPSPDSEPRG